MRTAVPRRSRAEWTDCPGRGVLTSPPDAAEKRLPVGGAGCQQQHKHDRRVDHGIAQRGRAHRQHRQHDHDRSGHARNKAGHRGLCQLFGQLGAHRRGILGALILTAVGYGDLRRFKRRDRIVLALILGTAGKAGGSLPDLGGGRDMGVGCGQPRRPRPARPSAGRRHPHSAGCPPAGSPLLMALAMSLTKAEVFGSAGAAPRFCV